MIFGFGRIEFDGNFINLNRPWTDFQPVRFTEKGELDSGSGITESLKGYSKWLINARLNLLDPQEKSQLQRLFEYAEDGSSFTLIRDRNLGTYIPFEGGINPSAAPRGLKTIDDTDGTFTRTNVADSAWYLDEGTRLLTLRDGADVPRFPAGKYGAGIQIDGAAVNLITHPSAFDNVAWSKVSMTIGANTPETLDPAETSTADKLTATSANGIATFTTSTAIGNQVAGAMWLKCSSGTISANLILDATVSGGKTEAITVTTSWKRFTVQDNTSGYSGDLRLSIQIPTNTEILYAWGAGLYDSAEFDLGTVGALSTSSITRNVEKLTYLSANVINRDKGTVLMWVKPRFDPTSFTTNALFFESGDSAGGVSDLHARIFYNLASDRLTLRVHQDNGSSQGINYNPGVSIGMTQNNNHYVAFTYDATVSNGGHIFVDGAELSTGSTNDPFNVSETGDAFAIGIQLNNGAPGFSTFDDILILKNVLSASEIKGLFDLGIGLGVPRNRWTVQLNDQVWNPRWLGSDVYDIPLLLKEVLT